MEFFFSDTQDSNINLLKLKDIHTHEDYVMILSSIYEAIKSCEGYDLIKIKLLEEAGNHGELLVLFAQNLLDKIVQQGVNPLNDNQSNLSDISVKKHAYLSNYWVKMTKKEGFTASQFIAPQIFKLDTFYSLLRECKKRPNDIVYLVKQFEERRLYDIELTDLLLPELLYAYYEIILQHLTLLNSWSMKLSINSYSYKEDVKSIRRAHEGIKKFYSNLRLFDVSSVVDEQRLYVTCEQIATHMHALNIINPV